MIRAVKGGFAVFSEGGKHLGGPYKTREQAEKRLREVEYFKARDREPLGGRRGGK